MRELVLELELVDELVGTRGVGTVERSGAGTLIGSSVGAVGVRGTTRGTD